MTDRKWDRSFHRETERSIWESSSNSARSCAVMLKKKKKPIFNMFMLQSACFLKCRGNVMELNCWLVSLCKKWKHSNKIVPWTCWMHLSMRFHNVQTLDLTTNCKQSDSSSMESYTCISSHFKIVPQINPNCSSGISSNSLLNPNRRTAASLSGI